MVPVEIAFLIGLVVLLYLALKARINAFVALIVSALVIGLLAGMPAAQVIKAITDGFGKTLSSIGIVIILGVMLGKYLEDSGAAEKMARSAVALVGQKNSPLAMAMSGYLISIPVFSDVGYVILAPLAKAISARSRISFPVLAVSLAGGLLATHVYVPPTPGPLAVAGLLGIDVGQMIVWGAFAALLMTLAGWAFAQFYLARHVETIIPDIPHEDAGETQLPTGSASFIPLLTPMILILFNTTAAMLLPEGNAIRSFAAFIGDANIAMGIGVLVAVLLLGQRLGKEAVLKVMDDALSTAGPIIFITAAGGSLGAVLKASGAGEAVAEAVAASGLPFILVPFFIAGLLKTIQGSGTVAVVTAATLCLPIANQLGLSPILIALASGAGARLICHVNDSFFWVYTKMSGFDTAMGLRTLAVGNVFMALGGLLATWIASLFL
ncbi:GntP family permease [Gelria sp. Kuro-4]|uniref:GntP family permease n=1 Tax=Gelria sp. Kuro-4 TaxID=2796927 RepID=UPI001BF11D3F|nr:gluconate:H+ symporter [Gelria sp. Kuro-4]BCV25933.1 gluconate permease [Gelria sp. Kuro-4]